MHRLRSQLILSILLALGFLGVGTTIIVTMASQADTERTLLRLYDQSIDQTLSQIAYPLAVKDLVTVNRILGLSGLAESVGSIRVKDDQGIIVYAKGEVDHCNLTTVREVEYADKRVGTIEACLPRSPKVPLLVWSLVATLLSLVIAAAVIFRTIRSRFDPIFLVLQRLEDIDLSAPAVELPQRLSPDVSKLITKISLVIKRIQDDSNRINDLALKAQMGQVVGQLAHDIQSPLTGIRMAVSSEKNMRAEAKELCEIALERIEAMVKELRNSNRASLSDSFFSPRLTVESVLRLKKLEYNHRALTLVSTGNSDEFLSTSISREHYARIISNLVNNSIESTDMPLSVVIDVSVNQSFLVTKVTDNGPGISPEILASLGSKRMTSKDSGSGIGFFSFKEGVELSGGRVEVDSSTSGTSVVFKIPVNSKGSV